MITVLHLNNLCIAFVIFSSEKLSSAEVGSSSNIISGFLINILAIANLCLCHPDNLIHFSQISVSIQASYSNTKSHSASFKASIISSSEASSFTLAWRFSLIVQSKTEGS
jgi:hypothetical protein